MTPSTDLVSSQIIQRFPLWFRFMIGMLALLAILSVGLALYFGFNPALRDAPYDIRDLSLVNPPARICPGDRLEMHFDAAVTRAPALITVATTFYDVRQQIPVNPSEPATLAYTDRQIIDRSFFVRVPATFTAGMYQYRLVAQEVGAQPDGVSVEFAVATSCPTIAPLPTPTPRPNPFGGS